MHSFVCELETKRREIANNSQMFSPQTRFTIQKTWILQSNVVKCTKNYVAIFPSASINEFKSTQM